MNKEFVLKANLIEHGIRISRNAKDTLDKQSSIWWLRNDYVTANGITLNFGALHFFGILYRNLPYSII